MRSLILSFMLHQIIELLYYRYTEKKCKCQGLISHKMQLLTFYLFASNQKNYGSLFILRHKCLLT